MPEIGGGGGSITAWLCERVGPDGSVTATDLEPRYLRRLQAKNLEVLRHDILADALPQNQFDFAHVRWLLHHLEEPRRALKSILKSLKPGGWLLAEEVDLASVVPDLEASDEAALLVSKCVQTMKELLAMRGGNYHYGRQLFRDIRTIGFVRLGSHGRNSIGTVDSAQTAIWRLTIAAVQDPALATKKLTEQELDALRSLASDPQFTWMGITTVACWGQKPPS
ncbi:MAG: class I SAM-dependent methyltransferase [Dehalococcoidia bacterium]